MIDPSIKEVDIPIIPKILQTTKLNVIVVSILGTRKLFETVECWKYDN